MNESSALAEAYSRSRFEIRFADASVARRIGVTDAACDQRLRNAGCHTRWCIITPCNPRSVPGDDATNSARLREMDMRLRKCGQRYLPTLASADDGTWPEPGFCVLDLAEHDAVQLARHYEQNAIVIGTLGDAPRLRWTGRAND